MAEEESDSDEKQKRVKTQPIPKITKTSEDGSSLPEAFDPSQVIAVIPAYNEERFIGSMVLKTLPYVREVIVVDDGSTDGTGSLAAIAGALVVRHEKNQGKGSALNTGLAVASQYQPGAVVVMDADGQHCIEELPKVVTPILEGKADLVIGSRYLEPTSEVPRHRIWGHWFFNLFTRLASGVISTDSQSGFRAFSKSTLDLLSFRSHGFSVESEMQFLAHEQNLRLLEVDITIQYKDKPKRSVVSHGLSVLNGILFLIGQYRPLLFFGLPGFITVLIGMAWGVVVVDRYGRFQELAVGYAMISILLTMIGMILLSTGITLHSIRGLLFDFLEHLKKNKV